MNSPLPPALLDQVRTAFEQISGLPLRVHVTDVEGRFLFANDSARAMFGFDPASDLSQFSIADFYEDERERQRVLKDLKKSPPHHWRKGFVVDLRIKGVWHSVRFSSLPFFDEHGELCAMLNMTDPMTWVERFADFENDLGVGLFEIDRYFKIVDCNQFLAEILGFQDPKELKDKPIGDFFWESDVPKILLEKLKANPKLRKESLKLKRTDGAVILAEMSCSAISLQDGEISRVKGVINDITFRVFQDDLPVGLFLINKNKDGKAIISQANLTFAKIHGYETVKEILGIPSDTFKSDPAEYEKYLAELAQAEKENRPLMDYYMEALDRAKQKRNVVVNVKFIPGQKGLIRVGAVYDLTNHMGKRTRTLEADFSALLHTYMATITGLLDTLGFVIKAQGQDVIKGDKHFDSDKAASEINSHRKRLESLLKEIEKMAVERDTGTPQIATLQRFWAKMIGGNTHVQGEKDNAAWQRRNLIEMRKTLDALKNVGLPRELLKNIRFEISELLRLTSVTSLSIALSELNERLPEFYYFQEYLRRSDAEFQDLPPQNIMPILIDAIKFLEGFASKHEISINQHFNTWDSFIVNCNRTSISRAFQSLLHNAIKYSKSRSGNNRPWIDVRVEKKKDTVEIVIENWGVAIRKEELENGEMFLFGKRGREADDNGRSGTGIGLYDAHNIIEKHGGTLRLTSESTFAYQPEVYSNPFITKAFINLPIAKLP